MSEKISLDSSGERHKKVISNFVHFDIYWNYCFAFN